MELLVGRVVKAHGISGELVVEIRTDDPAARFASGSTLARQGVSRGWVQSAVMSSTVCASTAGGCWCGWPEWATARPPTRCGAACFVVDSDDLPPIDEADTYYDHQLEGLRVRTTAGQDVGVVAEVLHTAAGELLAVRRGGGEMGEVAGAPELLVPFVGAMVPLVSLDEGIIEIDPPEGLLDLT